MAESTATAPSPARVHGRAAELIGHRAFWHREPYRGGLFSTEHFRVCSYCGSINPDDLIELLWNGGRLECTAKPGKFLLFTPNPVAGELVQMGTIPGPVFDKAHWPQDLQHHLYCDASPKLKFAPTTYERLSGHFERPLLEPAPAEITWPFYSDHTNARQWPQIWNAAQHGESNAKVQSA